MPSIKKIVITGGPCAGKTTAMSWIQNFFGTQGYAVLFIAETASELINSGISPKSSRTNLDFQKALLSLQTAKEDTFTTAALAQKQDKVLIVCDRGAMDNKAYMTKEEFEAVCHYLGKSEVMLRDSYDAVIHLVTAANGALEYYTLDNNQARSETPEEAIALDDKLIACWTGHPHLKVIDNQTGFDDKMKRMLTEIASIIGEPEPYAIKRKFLINYPDTALLDTLPNCSKVDIMQTYLLPEQPGMQVRIRQRGANGHYIYYKTVKMPGPGHNRVETETRLTKDEYLALFMQSDPSLRPIRKTRYCLSWYNLCYEIDIYPFWQDRAVMELALAEVDQAYEVPEFITIIREVTGDPAYSNYTLARELPAD